MVACFLTYLTGSDVLRTVGTAPVAEAPHAAGVAAVPCSSQMLMMFVESFTRDSDASPGS